MSHGNATTHVGTCQVCGREDVELHLARNLDRKTGERKFICVDEFACFAAWRAES